jgi:hypothetical protein
MSVSDDDYMELGHSNLIPSKDGWYINKITEERIDPNGFIFDKDGNLVHDPFDDEYQLHYNREEYDFFNG